MSTSNFFWEKYYFYVLGIILCYEHMLCPFHSYWMPEGALAQKILKLQKK